MAALTKSVTCLIVLLALAGSILDACSDFPGADGRYATHDRGRNNHP